MMSNCPVILPAVILIKTCPYSNVINTAADWYASLHQDDNDIATNCPIYTPLLSAQDWAMDTTRKIVIMISPQIVPFIHRYSRHKIGPWYRTKDLEHVVGLRRYQVFFVWK